VKDTLNKAIIAELEKALRWFMASAPDAVKRAPPDIQRILEKVKL
jgi:hypothetical protein